MDFPNLFLEIGHFFLKKEQKQAYKPKKAPF
ncbi:hypothetical protein SGRA_2680 [Saprospira grandis str. Lewin]|uniref:Uncharacterized protein n=1 Tax=Saprospira grandis (strain Lewin) TaxID=984262 RepID=H6L9D2_SAPGL|nr:hypothetical protein SGRA_2680 [Saprospira grandis str. Lewin]